jgi:hypothetical protein
VTTNRIIGRTEYRDVLLEEGGGFVVELARREMDKRDEALKAEMDKGLTSEPMKKYLTQKILRSGSGRSSDTTQEEWTIRV